jgi:hypothetical protein
MTSDSGQHASLILVIVNAQKGITMSRESAATTSEVSRGDKAHINLALEIGLLTALSLICSSSFTLMKVAVETIPPLTMTSARVGIAALLLVLTARMLDSSLAYRMLNKTTPTMKWLRHAAASKSTMFWMALSARW